MSTEFGGPAFPVTHSYNFGMSLRDYFAAQALPECLRFELREATFTGYLGNYGQQVAVNAYAIADALLAERSKA